MVAENSVTHRRGISGPEPKPIDPVAYKNYIQIMNEVEQETRRNSMREAKHRRILQGPGQGTTQGPKIKTLEDLMGPSLKNGSPVPSSRDYYDDSIMMPLFRQTFGTMDERSPQFYQLHKTFTAAKIKQVREWEILEKNEDYLNAPSKIQQLEEQITQMFTPAQIKSFSLNPDERDDRREVIKNLPRKRFEPESKSIEEIPLQPINHAEIPSKFVQWSTHFPSLSDKIEEGSYLRCLPGDIYSPSKFFLNLVEHFDQHERFMKSMQQKMKALLKTWKPRESLTPDSPCLIPGLHVMAEYKVPGDKLEWHRGKIIKKLSDQIYEILMIDYGSKSIVKIGSIKYMPMEFMTRMPVQGIECGLVLAYFVRPDEKWRWSDNVAIQNLLRDKVLGVQFVKRASYKVGKEEKLIWSVKIDIMAGTTQSYCNPNAPPFDPKNKPIQRPTYEHMEFIRDVQTPDISNIINALLRELKSDD